ncbi:MAG: phage terminase large subunit [Candidatus Sericytochromatia bacterium]|nr:phage terminase large subunit [Candidatus Tanganyikabacteria bacterium]
MSDLLAEFDALLRMDFEAFVEKAIATLRPGHRIGIRDYMRAIFHALELARRGEEPNQIINLPPRSLKSTIVSVAWVCWLLGHRPDLHVIVASYADELAKDFARDRRRIMASAWYRRAFPGARLSPSKNTETEFETVGGGSCRAVSVKGTLTGLGGDVIIVDDPMNAAHAASDAERGQVKRWFDGVLASRENAPGRTVVLVVMQRLHEDDLTGHLVDKGGYRVLRLPLIAGEDEAVAIGHGQVWRRKAGEVLDPDHWPEEAIARIRRRGSATFFAQYQQEPQPAGGNLFKRAWLRYGDPPKQPADLIVQSWDTASKIGEANDYSVCVTLAQFGRDTYVIDLWRGRLEFPDLKRKVQEMAARYEPAAIVVEDAGSGIALIQALKVEGKLDVRAYKPQSNEKTVRAMQQTALVEGGRLILQESAGWLDAFVAELLAFPNGKFDDQVDALVQGLAWLGEFAQYVPSGDLVHIGALIRDDPFPDF